jgi:adenosylcobinamide-phosphate synthase
MDAILTVAALLIDTAVGDPRSAWHPVVIIGKLIAFLEKCLLRSNQTPKWKLFSGALLVFIVLAVTYGIVWLLLSAAVQIHPRLSFCLQAILLSFTISPRSLAEAAHEIRGYLETGNLAQARYKIGWIVGRDTQNLDSGEITRATVETVAENIVDGIISPLFYFAIGGVPLAFLYRAVNTMDSMIGYKNDKYFYFGKIAARLDDVFNYIPARITGLLLVIAALLLRLNPLRSLHMVLRDAAKHPSPNSGIAEAAVAGALGVQLGGLNYYGGIPSLRARMGDPVQPLAPSHIRQTVRIMYLTTVLYLVFILAANWLTKVGGL